MSYLLSKLHSSLLQHSRVLDQAASILSVSVSTFCSLAWSLSALFSPVPRWGNIIGSQGTGENKADNDQANEQNKGYFVLWNNGTQHSNIEEQISVNWEVYQPGKYVACIYDANWYVGNIKDLSGTLSNNERQYRSMPTHGIGRYKYLLPKQAPKKKRGKQPMKKIKAATETEYGFVNVKISGYDMTLVEHYSQYIHNLCNRLKIKVEESYALPTKTTEIMVMQEQGTKMYVDAVLKTHERVVQLSDLSATMCPVFMEVLLKNQPEGVQVSLKEHTEADYQSRFKARPELEELMAQMS